MKSLNNYTYDQNTSNSFQPFKKKRNYEERITQKADSSNRKPIDKGQRGKRIDKRKVWEIDE